LAYLLPALPRRTRPLGLLAYVAEALRPAFASRDKTSRPKATHRPAATPLGLADQWSRLARVIGRSVTGAETAQKLQLAATQQLDLAQYGISTLIDELSAVMIISGRRDRQATLHVLGSAFAAEELADRAFKEQPHKSARAA
jgi:hypothetical protein